MGYCGRHFVEGAPPEVEGVGQDVGLAAEGELGGLAGGDVLGFEALPRCAVAAFFGDFEGILEAAIDAAAGVDGFLDGDFVGRALEEISAGTGVEALVVFTDDDEVDVLRALVLERAVLGAEQLHRAEVDVLLQFEAQAQEDAFFENAGLAPADGRRRRGRWP